MFVASTGNPNKCNSFMTVVSSPPWLSFTNSYRTEKKKRIRTTDIVHCGSPHFLDECKQRWMSGWRKTGMDKRMDGGRETGMDGGREGDRDGWREGGRQGWMSGWMEKGRKTGMDEWMDEWMDGEKERKTERKKEWWLGGWMERGKAGTTNYMYF